MHNTRELYIKTNIQAKWGFCVKKLQNDCRRWAADGAGRRDGISKPTASELELTVVFETARQVPGFNHEDVVSITPPARTLGETREHGDRSGGLGTIIPNLQHDLSEACARLS